MNMFLSLHRLRPLLVLAAIAGGASASASEMVYYPINPAFGGNPNNASGLLSVAQAQNHFKSTPDSPLKTFNDNLQRAIFSRLSSEAMTKLFGPGSVLSPGTYETAGFTIDVKDTGGGTLTIVTTDKSTGATVSFTVASDSYSADTSGL